MGSTSLLASKKAKSKSKISKTSSNKDSGVTGIVDTETTKQASSKKRKAEAEGYEKPVSQPEQDGSKDLDKSPTLKKKESKSKPRKTVTFSEDTQPQEKTAELELTVDPEDDPDSLANRRAAKRRKREERRKDRSTMIHTKPESKAISDPILSYLSTYYHARDDWKFQKNRETAVLKHCFSIDRIPFKYNPALRAYLSSLKGEAAKKRIVEAAREAITIDDKSTSDPTVADVELQRSTYDDAVDAFRSQLEAKDGDYGNEQFPAELSSSWHKRLNARKRAELILCSLQGSVVASKPQPPKKVTRKTRTAIVSDSSSSSGSDSDSESTSDSGSDSESDSESSDASIVQKASRTSSKGTKAAEKSKVEDSSSESTSGSDSSTSTSSSGSDSDSDSD